jgi:hypothetical protein
LSTEPDILSGKPGHIEAKSETGPGTGDPNWLQLLQRVYKYQFPNPGESQRQVLLISSGPGIHEGTNVVKVDRRLFTHACAISERWDSLPARKYSSEKRERGEIEFFVRPHQTAS